ncbi:MAG: hypothetical protein ACP5HZ_12355, partial [Ferrimicrobium sp.]
ASLIDPQRSQAQAPLALVKNSVSVSILVLILLISLNIPDLGPGVSRRAWARPSTQPGYL